MGTHYHLLLIKRNVKALFFDMKNETQKGLDTSQTNPSFPSPYYPGDDYGDPSLGDNVSVVFLISLTVTLGMMLLVLLLIVIYVTCINSDDEEYDQEMGVSVIGTDGVRRPVRGLGALFNRASTSSSRNSRNGASDLVSFGSGPINLNDDNFKVPGSFDDSEELRTQERTYIEGGKFSDFEIELYYRGKEFQQLNPPLVKPFNTYNSVADKQLIKDRGVEAFYFLPSINDKVTREGSFLPSFIVQDKLDITFTRFNESASTILNFPLPFNGKDAVYFEVKVFKFPPQSNSIFSIGLMTPPYPYFRLPGYNKYSIAYESTGKLRINNPFHADTLLPKIQEGDVIGFGYRFRTGTIFITHNGKKMMDLTHNYKADMFIGIGCMNSAYTRTYTRDGMLEDPDNVTLKNNNGSTLPLILQNVHNPKVDDVSSDEVELHVNLGQVGFVFIEANARKYAFSSPHGTIGVPPNYHAEEIKTDKLLQKGEELPPKYPIDEMGFFGNISVNMHGPSLLFSQSSKSPQAQTNKGQQLKVKSVTEGSSLDLIGGNCLTESSSASGNPAASVDSANLTIANSTNATQEQVKHTKHSKRHKKKKGKKSRRN